MSYYTSYSVKGTCPNIILYGPPGHASLNQEFRSTSVFSEICLCFHRYSGVDLNSQEAYELAVKGMLRPRDKSTPILTGLRCVHFKPPHFKLGKIITGHISVSQTVSTVNTYCKGCIDRILTHTAPPHECHNYIGDIEFVQQAHYCPE